MLRRLGLVVGFFVLCAGCGESKPTTESDGGGGAAGGNGGDANGLPPDTLDADEDQAPDGEGADTTPSPAATCPEGAKPGATGQTNSLKTPSGVTFNVRAPSGYKPTVGSPLIVIYAAAGADRNSMERNMGFTAPALSRGFIVAYADHIDFSRINTLELIKRALEVITKATNDWCVDPKRIHMGGHSDGATTLNAIMQYHAPPPLLAATAPSASGTVDVNGACPKQPPFASIVMHSKNDQLFPGRGRKLADYYIRCNKCNSTPNDEKPDGCLVYEGCENDATIQYCEGTKQHGIYPGNLNAHVLDFLLTHPRM